MLKTERVHPKWHPTPYISALLLTRVHRALIKSTVAHHEGNRGPFWTHPQVILLADVI